MALPREYETQACALARALEVVGERWTLLIVRDLFFGVTRFTDIQAHLDVPRAVPRRPASCGPTSPSTTSSW